MIVEDILEGYIQRKEYLRIFNLIIVFFISSYIYADGLKTQQFYPDFNILEDGTTIRLVFVKNNDPSGIKKAKIYSVNQANEKEYVTKIVDDELISVFQAKGIADGNSVYLITRSKVQDGVRTGYYYSTTELPIIKEPQGVYIRFFKGDPVEPSLTNCFDGIVNADSSRIVCKYTTPTAIKEYIAELHAKSIKECEALSFQDENGNEDIYRSGNKCFYSEKSVLESYHEYKKINAENETGQYLRNTIIKGSNYHDVIENGYLDISYTWINNQKLEIKLLFSGGVTTLLFEENENGTEVSTIYDAD